MKNLVKNLALNFRKIFSIMIIDGHYVIYFLGFRIRIKQKVKVEKICLEQLQSIKNNKQDNTTNPKLIVSLTTFPQRINSVSKTIKTLLNQSLKPDKVVLWLAIEEFPQKEKELPKELLELREYGLEIDWCNNIKSYKKLIPALKKYKNDIIVTVDDDIYYPKDVLERLYKSYQLNPQAIHSNRGRRLYVDKDRICAISPFENYCTRFNDVTYKNTITGCGGVLYPPNSLDSRIFDEEMFQKILPTQDDVWFWAMAVLNNTKIKIVASFDINLITVEDTQEFGLSKINKKINKKGINSLEGIRLIAKTYPEIKEKLITQSLNENKNAVNKKIEPESKLISIIVPVYNSQDFLHKCLDSLINQTYKNIEIICINDGSCDNSLDILNEYKNKDNRIVVLTQDNQKQGAARNRGLEVARGEYICFIDSDDWVDLDYIEKLYCAIVGNNADVAMSCVVKNRVNNTQRYLLNNKKTKVVEINKKTNNLINALIVPPDWYIVCAKLFKKEVLNAIRFKEQVYYEDPEFLIRASLNIKKVVMVEKTAYHYFENVNSTIRANHTPKKEKDRYDSVLGVFKFAKDNNIKIKDYCYKREKYFLITKKHYIDETKYYFCGIKVFSKKQPVNI